METAKDYVNIKELMPGDGTLTENYGHWVTGPSDNPCRYVEVMGEYQNLREDMEALNQRRAEEWEDYQAQQAGHTAA